MSWTLNESLSAWVEATPRWATWVRTQEHLLRCPATLSPFLQNILPKGLLKTTFSGRQLAQLVAVNNRHGGRLSCRGRRLVRCRRIQEETVPHVHGFQVLGIDDKGLHGQEQQPKETGKNLGFFRRNTITRIHSSSQLGVVHTHTYLRGRLFILQFVWSVASF